MRPQIGEMRPSAITQALLGMALIAIGEMLLLIHARPYSDYYFPFVWFGFILLMDGAVRRQTGRSLLSAAPERFLALLPISVAFWWLFELFNLAVGNWIYIGGRQYTGIAYVAFASLDFSTVLAALWVAAQLVNVLLPGRVPSGKRIARVPNVWLAAMFGSGVVSVVLPVLQPSYFFGLIWLSMFLLLDPLNAWLGRPSIVRAVLCGNWRLPIALALGGLLCGVCWEAWNYWAMPKWIYNVPHVSYLHVFEMPLAGYMGYLPFGLEAFAVTNFVLPFLGMKPLKLQAAARSRPRRDMAA